MGLLALPELARAQAPSAPARIQVPFTPLLVSLADSRPDRRNPQAARTTSWMGGPRRRSRPVRPTCAARVLAISRVLLRGDAITYDLRKPPRAMVRYAPRTRVRQLMFRVLPMTYRGQTTGFGLQVGVRF